MMLRLVVALTWIFWSSRFFVAIYRFPGATLLTVLFAMGGLGLFAASLISMSSRWRRRIDVTAFVGSIIGLVLWAVSLVASLRGYGTDEAAFTQGAARLLLDGHNPYGADLSRFLQTYAVSPGSWTTTLTGGYVHELGYPALSFLFTVPLLAIGVTVLSQIWVNVALFCVGAVILWFRLPAPARNVVPLLLALDAYGSAVSGGLIFGIAMPFAVLGVAYWDRFGEAAEPALTRWFGPIFLGLACAVRQDLWVLVPFIAIGVAHEARADGQRPMPRAARYLGLAAAGFLVPNLPFILWSPTAWIEGVLSPLLQGLVPLGQGAIGLSLYLGAGGANLHLYTLIMILLVALLLLICVVRYEWLKPALPIIPALVLFASTRSLAQYVLFGAIVAISAIATVRRARAPIGRVTMPSGETAVRFGRLQTPRAMRWRGGRFALLAVGVVLTGLVIAAAAAVSWPPPLTVSVASVHTTGQQGSVDEVTVTVHNSGTDSVRPKFIVGGGPYLGRPWLTAGGSIPTFAPGATETVTLRAPGVVAMPSVDNGFKVYAFTASPPSVSSSRVVTLGRMFSRLVPNTAGGPVRAGDAYDMGVQLVDRYGRPIQRYGVRVALGQAQYTPTGLFAGEAIVNGGPIGASPTVALTDKAGIAHFTIMSPRPLNREIFFQAWIANGAPQGYSKQIAIWFDE